MPLYFAYGSNMLRARLEQRVGTVTDLGCQPLEQYRHAFEKRGEDGTAKGAILPHGEHTVYGVVYSVSAAQLDALSVFEGGYRRVEVSVTGRPAETFEPLPDALQAGLFPTEEYVRYYLEGMAEHGFPVAYVRMIESQVRVR